MGQCYRHLTLEERRTAFHLKAAKVSVEAISDRLGRGTVTGTRSCISGSPSATAMSRSSWLSAASRSPTKLSGAGS